MVPRLHRCCNEVCKKKVAPVREKNRGRRLERVSWWLDLDEKGWSGDIRAAQALGGVLEGICVRGKEERSVGVVKGWERVRCYSRT